MAPPTTTTALAIHEPMPSRLLTAQDVAALLGVPDTWVYSQTRAGRIPTVKLGRYYRYRRDAIQQWIEAMEIAA